MSGTTPETPNDQNTSDIFQSTTSSVIEKIKSSDKILKSLTRSKKG
jgi:hypothetical protein